MVKRYKIKYKVNNNELSKVCYGDSVTDSTPVMLRDPENGNIFFKRIDQIVNEYEKYPGFKIFDNTIGDDKEYGSTNLQIWSDKGWSDIKKVIRHKTKKQIYSISTDKGYVEVTSDHSLVDEDYNLIKPEKLSKDYKLLTRYCMDFNNTYTGLDENNAYMCGLMMLDGEYEEVPEDILNGPVEQAEQFLEAYNSDITEFKVSCVQMAGLYYLYKKTGKKVKVKRNETEHVLVEMYKNPIQFTNDVKKIDYCGEYVYDIETEIGRFQAGVGEIIVKNTDSCMIELNTKALVEYKNIVDDYKEIINLTQEEKVSLEKYKTRAIEEAFDQGKELAQEITSSLFKYPINLEFEKVYTNFLILSKKRYLGNYYGKNPYTIDMVEKKGVVLKRRDNPDIVKRVYSGVVNPILEHGKRGVNISVKFLKNELEKLMKNDVDLNELVITKSLAKGYGKPDKKGEIVFGEGDYKSMNLPHVSLANKMRDRDPGSAPLIGDRINYVFVDIPDNPKAKLYEKAEDLNVAITEKMEIDYLYYVTNQIQNPVSEILNILVSDCESIFKDATKEYVKRKDEELKLFKIKSSMPKGQQSILRWIKPKD